MSNGDEDEDEWKIPSSSFFLSRKKDEDANVQVELIGDPQDETTTAASTATRVYCD